MGRLPNTQQRRQQIVAAFMRVVAYKGYSGTSIQDIAKEAGMAAGLIHYHFESKQEILLTLFSRIEALIRERMESALEKLGHAKPLAALDALIDAFLALNATANRLAVNCWTMISAEAVYNPALSRVYTEVIHKQLFQIERLIQLAAKPTTSRKTIRATAAAILAAIHGSFLLASTAPRTIPAGSAASSVKLMARGLLQKVRPA